MFEHTCCFSLCSLMFANYWFEPKLIFFLTVASISVHVKFPIGQIYSSRIMLFNLKDWSNPEILVYTEIFGMGAEYSSRCLATQGVRY